MSAKGGEVEGKDRFGATFPGVRPVHLYKAPHSEGSCAWFNAVLCCAVAVLKFAIILSLNLGLVWEI